MEVVSGDNWTYWSYKSCKAPGKSSSPFTNKPTPRMPFLSPNQHCQSTEGNNITFHGLAYPKLDSSFVSDTNSSWIPWGRVAMPLISPLMPVPLLRKTNWFSQISVERWHMGHGRTHYILVVIRITLRYVRVVDIPRRTRHCRTVRQLGEAAHTDYRYPAICFSN